MSAPIFITAVGCLSVAQAPAWPGQDRFRGQVFHTAQWPHEEPDLTGKRVGVVGTGSSAIQAIPLLAERAERLYVFQRTATFSLPARNAPTDPAAERELKANYPALRDKARHSPIGNFWDLPVKSALEVTEEEREETFERFWAEGSSASSSHSTTLAAVWRPTRWPPTSCGPRSPNRSRTPR